MNKYLFYIILTLGLLSSLYAETLTVKPYAQWTFDTAIEQVVFLESSPAYPIYMIRTENAVSLYDSTGEIIRKIDRLENDKFVLNSARTGFMLIHDQEIAESAQKEHNYSFQVYTSKGAADYTSVYRADFSSGELEYQLTDDRDIILTEQGQPWLLKIHEDDTLLYIESVATFDESECNPLVLVGTLNLQNELVTATSCLRVDSLDPASVNLKIWNQTESQNDFGPIDGELQGIRNIPESDYYFLELDHGAESSLTLFNRTTAITTYPWKSWEIRALDQTEAFIISEKDFNVINLGDGALSAMYHPIELRGISDAAYMQDWGIFLYLRYMLYFTKDGKQAFRNFVLEGVDRSGQLVHRSSFGTWSTILPKISPVGRDRFAIHIHNAVLLYEINIENE